MFPLLAASGRNGKLSRITRARELLAKQKSVENKTPIMQKHREVLKKMDDNGGISREEAMRRVGYSRAYARSAKLSHTDSWQALLQERLPDDELLRVHKEGLAATKIHSSHTEPDKIVSDYLTRHKYLVTGYELRGKLKRDITENKTLIINISGENAERYAIASNASDSSER